MRKTGESLESALRRTKIREKSEEFLLLRKKDKQIAKAKREIRIKDAQIQRVKAKAKPTYTCVYCQKQFSENRFNHVTLKTKTGVCKTCKKDRDKITRRMERSSEANVSTNQIMSEAINKIIQTNNKAL